MQEHIGDRHRASPLRRLHTLARSTPQRKILVIEAILSLATARMALAILPFRRVARPLGMFVSSGDDRASSPASGPSTNERDIARDIGWAVCAVAPWLPFKAVCLQQALAAHAMLRRRGISATLHLGTGPDEQAKLTAHAWLDAAGVKVTGYPIAPHLTEIGCFI